MTKETIRLEKDIQIREDLIAQLILENRYLRFKIQKNEQGNSKKTTNEST